VRRIGHKGAAGLETGNTIASFERAVEHGVDTIEFDVLWLEDGRPSRPAPQRSPLVIAHDWHDAAERVPLTLDEALDAFTRPPLDRVEFDVDMKLIGREEEIVAAIRDRDLLERARVSTMYVESLAKVAALEPTLRRGWSYPLVTRAWDQKRWARPFVGAALLAMRERFPAHARRRVPELGVGSIWLYHLLATRRLVEVADELGIELICWTVDEADHVDRLAAMGVHGIVTNDPRLLGAHPPHDDLAL
jgi:glycerophosphoryl diester phosphodiesterase